MSLIIAMLRTPQPVGQILMTLPKQKGLPHSEFGIRFETVATKINRRLLNNKPLFQSQKHSCFQNKLMRYSDSWTNRNSFLIPCIWSSIRELQGNNQKHRNPLFTLLSLIHHLSFLKPSPTPPPPLPHSHCPYTQPRTHFYC